VDMVSTMRLIGYLVVVQHTFVTRFNTCTKHLTLTLAPLKLGKRIGSSLTRVLLFEALSMVKARIL
jgi:hypothetical protein